MATDDDAVFAVNLAAIAREVAMDILPVAQIMQLHQLDDETWQRIQANPKFQEMLTGLIAEWQSATGTRERIKLKAQTGLESQLDEYISAISDTDIPLTQRVEAGKFLAHLGELMGKEFLGGQGGAAFQITLNIGATHHQVTDKVIDGSAVRTAIPE